jgi:ubiquinone/menaquinone biosynthesis C-methylase UbiE
MEETQRRYLPAAGHDWLLPLYDPLVQLLGGESAHRHLLDQASVRPGHRVLEIGCGTGNLAILLKRRNSWVKVVGLDPDPKALARARRKAEREALLIQFDRGFSDALPYRNGSFDRVFSAFMFHHLQSLDEKRKTLSEARRVLVAAGSLHLLDFGGSRTKAQGFFERFLHRTERLQDNTGDRVLSLMEQAGFEDPTEVGHRTMAIFGGVTYYRASSPQAGV